DRRFFYQAEDGIRDDLVTGVQTCALPISWRSVSTTGVVETLRQVKDEGEIDLIRAACALVDRAFEFILTHIRPGVPERDLAIEQIGRASCRGRVRSARMAVCCEDERCRYV